MAVRILELDVQLPALYLISLNNGKITTTELSNLLRSIMKPSGEDLEILANRKDDKFSQIIRNLTAPERSFVKNGFIARENDKNKPLHITDKGKQYLSENISIVKYLLSNDFKYIDILSSLKTIEKEKREIESFDETIMIKEGFVKIIKSKIYERSSKLRNIAIEHYTKSGDILCDSCDFSFNDFYGVYGKGFIEIHHIKPIFKFVEEELNKTIEDALNNVSPLCSNCHRMVHRKKETLSIGQLKTFVNENGIYKRA